MAPKTDHELQADADEQERTDFTNVQALRNGLMRECPAGRFLDREHLRNMIRQQPSTNRPWLAWAYLAVHSAAAARLGAGVFTEDLGLNAATVERFRAHDVWWDPDPQRLASLPPEYRARVIGAR